MYYGRLQHRKINGADRSELLSKISGMESRANRKISQLHEILWSSCLILNLIVMKLWTTAEIRTSIAKTYFGLDLSKNYYELRADELASLLRFKRVCNFRRKDTKGWSQAQYFWQYLKSVYNRQEEVRKKYGLPF